MKTKLFWLPLLGTMATTTPAFAATRNESVGWSLAGTGAQIGLGLVLAAVGIAMSLRLLARELPELDFGEQLKAMNRSVALLAAGVIVAFTKIVGTGIAHVSWGITTHHNWKAFASSLISVGIAISVAGIAVSLAFRALARATPNVALADELQRDNIAFGVVVFAVFYGVAELASAGTDGIAGPLSAAFMNLF